MKPYWTNGKSTLYHADARSLPLADGSVHCAITSPPYWGLRDYGLGDWHGGDADCGHERRAKDRQKAHGLTDRLPDTAAYSGDALEAWPNNTCGHCGAVQESAGIGTEPTLAEHIANIVAVFRELRRVLRDDGTAWLNYGDAYNSSSHWKGFTNAQGQSPARRAVGEGLPAKSLLGLPWRVAFALQDDGWVLRSAIVWKKNNPMPESVTDRPTNAYENVFLLAKSNSATYWTHRDQRGTRDRPEPDYRWVDAATDTEYSVKPDNVSGEIIECPACDGKGEIVRLHGQVSLFDGVPELVETCAKCHTECKKCDAPHAGYLHRWKRINLWQSHDYFYDADAIREATKPYGGEQPGSAKGKQAKALAEGRSEAHSGKGMMSPDYTRPTSANARNVWSIPTQGRSEKHYASFPDELPRRCILAGTSERGVCEQCGAPWSRTVEREFSPQVDVSRERGVRGASGQKEMDQSSGWDGFPRGNTVVASIGWRPTCDHDAGTVPATVLDCFVGSGTTVAVAQTLGRRGVGVDLSAEYLDIAVKRIGGR